MTTFTADPSVIALRRAERAEGKLLVAFDLIEDALVHLEEMPPTKHAPQQRQLLDELEEWSAGSYPGLRDQIGDLVHALQHECEQRSELELAYRALTEAPRDADAVRNV